MLDVESRSRLLQWRCVKNDEIRITFQPYRESRKVVIIISVSLPQHAVVHDPISHLVVVGL